MIDGLFPTTIVEAILFVFVTISFEPDEEEPDEEEAVADEDVAAMDELFNLFGEIWDALIVAVIDIVLVEDAAESNRSCCSVLIEIDLLGDMFGSVFILDSCFISN